MPVNILFNAALCFVVTHVSEVAEEARVGVCFAAVSALGAADVAAARQPLTVQHRRRQPVER